MSFSPERLRLALEACLSLAGRPAPTSLCVALSGGLDSTVLLAALAEDPPRPLRAVHVDHGLHPDSPRWAEACQTLAAGLGVPLAEARVAAHPAPGESPEAAARAARYAAIAATLRPGEALLTAHHADDQLETVLLQWLRGGGLRAVAGMAPCARLGRAWQLRPLLGFTRAELHAWARVRGLVWLEDPSNADPRFDRNYLRLEVLPALRERWPAIARTAGRVAAYAAEALEAEAAVAAADLAAVAEGATLVLEPLQALPQARARAVLRAWLRALGLPVPAQRTLAALLHDMRAAAGDRIPSVNWPGAVVHRYRGRLYASPPEPKGPPVKGPWWPARGLRVELGAAGALELVAAQGTGLSRTRLPERLEVGARVAGVSFQAAGHAHRRPLRKWLQEHGVLPWRRESLPIITTEAGEVVAVADLACAAEFAARPDEPSWCVRWHGRPILREVEVRSFNWPADPPIL